MVNWEGFRKSLDKMNRIIGFPRRLSIIHQYSDKRIVIMWYVFPVCVNDSPEWLFNWTVFIYQLICNFLRLDEWTNAWDLWFNCSTFSFAHRLHCKTSAGKFPWKCMEVTCDPHVCWPHMRFACGGTWKYLQLQQAYLFVVSNIGI